MITAVLIRCSDPRIDKAIDALINRGGRCAVIANTGSIKYFLVRDKLSDLTNQIDILAKGFGANKIILITHTNCGFYKQLGQDERAHYLSDLRHVKEFLLGTFPQMKVECYIVDTKTLRLESVAKNR